jgi:hypothetical protein
MLHVCVHCYFSMDLCIYISYLYVHVLYTGFRKSFVRVCFKCMQLENFFMWHSSVGCWVGHNMFHTENKCVL